MPTQLTWSAMIRSLSFDRQSAERLKTESSIFCLAQLDIGTPNETRFSSNLFKLLNASKKPFFFLARISWVKWFVLDIFVLFPFICIQLSFALSRFISFQGKTGQMLGKLWNSQYESRSTMNGSMIRNRSWASVGFFFPRARVTNFCALCMSWFILLLLFFSVYQRALRERPAYEIFSFGKDLRHLDFQLSVITLKGAGAGGRGGTSTPGFPAGYALVGPIVVNVNTSTSLRYFARLIGQSSG